MPNTVNKFLNTPNTGDLTGAWGTTAVNFNMSALDGTLGGFATISLSSATTFALSLPTGASTSLTPGAGPTQSQNALLKFTGTLSGNAVVQFTMPGFYIVHNACTVGSFSIKLSPSAGTGNSIGAPPGRKAHVFFDGTDMDYVDMPEVGSALDLHQSGTTIPAWISVCTVQPYLLKDGTVYNISTYPQLGAALGSTFGGNGATTFGVPDDLSRIRVPVDTTASKGRITSAGSGINGTTMGAVGGAQNVTIATSNIPLTSVSFTGFAAPAKYINTFVVNAGAAASVVGDSGASTLVATVGTTSPSVVVDMPPVIVNFIPLIKT